MSVVVPAGLRAAVVVGVAALLISSCIKDGAVRSDDDDASIVTPGELNAYDIRVGDCFMDDGLFGDSDDTELNDAEEITSVEVVPCDAPHDNEVFALYDLPDGDFPGTDEISEIAVDGCVDRFAEFAGIGFYETSLDVFWLVPSETSWESIDDREVVCAIFDPAGPLDLSVAGAGGDYPIEPFAVGDCLDVDWTTVDCAVEHDMEVFLAGEIEAGDYPGDKAVGAEAVEMCMDAFTDYVGIEYEESILEFSYTAPDQASWDEGDRAAVCTVYDPAGQSSGSFQGSGT